MSRIAGQFKLLKAQGRCALIPFITAGDPEPGVTVPLMHTLVEAGADIIELGVPFSDPMAEGPVIQHACERALQHHVSLHDVLSMVKRFRQTNTKTPVILMGYLNPVEVMGYETFAAAAAEAGVDGILTVDLPPEEADEYVPAMKARGLDAIFLLAPTSTEERMRRVADVAGGFVYYVSLRGVTGAGNLDTREVADKLDIIRSHTNLPIGVGFGIHDAATAAEIATVADAVVVGSALVRRVGDLADEPEKINAAAGAFIKGLRLAIDNVGAAA
ncbi:MAG: tryptophan synthase subunit alpha [Gammaproteobacteria bacterium]|nr:MAG: tryptophan synthase subunit alpha [Gammaproteobacteria bacterium]